MNKEEERLFWESIVKKVAKKYGISVDDTNLDVHTHSKAFRKFASDWKEISITLYK